MKKDVRKMHSVVEKILINNESARKNDNNLIVSVLKELGFDTRKPLNDVFKDPQMPSLESITRARRKLQSENPNLKDKRTAQLRAEQEQIYKDYSKEGLWN